MNLLAGATGFLGNEILNELGLLEDQTLVLTRRKMDTLPMNTDQLIIDFNKILELELPQIDHVFLSLGFPLFFHNVMGFMNKNNKELPWPLSFSYGRALQEPCLKAWSGNSDNIKIAQKALLHREKCNGLACKGEYDKKMEEAA